MAAEAMFTGSQPRRWYLKDGYLKVNKEKERRINLEFEIKLTDENMAGAHLCIQHAWSHIETRENAVGRQEITKEFLHTIEICEVPDVAPRLTLTACTLKNIKVSRPTTETNKDELSVLFCEVDVAATEAIWKWVYEGKSYDFFARLYEVQAEMAIETPGTDMKQGDLAMEKPRCAYTDGTGARCINEDPDHGGAHTMGPARFDTEAAKSEIENAGKGKKKAQDGKSKGAGKD